MLKGRRIGGSASYRKLRIVLVPLALRVIHMKKKTVNAKKSGSAASAKVKHASRRKKSNEVSSDGSLRSSLTTDVGLTPSMDDASGRAGQSGDIQGISNIAEADPESVEELLDDGQAFEAEVISGVEDARDEREVPSRGRLETEGQQDEAPHSFNERNKI